MCVLCIVKEAIEIHLNKNFNRERWLYTEPHLVTCNQHISEQKSRTEQNSYLTPPIKSLVSPLAIMGRYFMKLTDFGGSQFPDDLDRDGFQNVDLHTVQPSVAAACLIIYYCNLFVFNFRWKTLWNI